MKNNVVVGMIYTIPIFFFADGGGILYKKCNAIDS